MFKKLKNYLLTNHPLVWNTRFVIACSAALLINIIFVLIGYSAYGGLQELQNYQIYNSEESFILPSVLVSVLFFIVWLFYYTKNNAFKNFYPLKKGYLVKEFFLIVIIITFNCSYIFSYRFGHASHAKQSVQDIDLVKLINRANQAMMFLPIQQDDYEIGNSCDSLNKYRSQYNINNGEFEEVEYAVESAYHNVHKGISIADQRTKDSLWQVFVTHFTDSIRKADNLHEKDRIWVNYEKFHPKPVATYDDNETLPEVAYNVNEDDVKSREIAPIKERPRKYSYYFYCRQYFSLDDFGHNTMKALYPLIDSNKSISQKGIALIKAKDTKAIENIIDDFKADLIKSKIHHTFNTSHYVQQAIRDSILRKNGNYTLESYNGFYDKYNYDAQYASESNNYIATTDLDYFIENTTKLQFNFSKQVGDALSFLALIFTSLALAFAIFLFRLNGIKEFLLSIVAGGVLSLAIGLFMYLAKMNSSIEALYTFGTIGIGLTLLGYLAIKTKFVKLRAAICLNIGTFSLGMMWFVLYGSLYEIFKSKAVFYTYGSIKKAFSIERYSPFYEWLRTEYITILWIYAVLILLTIFLYLIPLSKKLRANPDE